jgi:hypothetical protein
MKPMLLVLATMFALAFSRPTADGFPVEERVSQATSPRMILLVIWANT